MRSLSDRVIIVTGASSGLGRAIALAAWSRGARLALCGRSAEKLAAVVAELRSATALPAAADASEVRLFAEAFDATDEAAVSGFVARAAAALGPAEVLVNCAGANTARGPVLALAGADLRAMLELNLLAPLAFIRAACPAMREAGRGLVVNVLSSVCLFSNEGIGGYTASKCAFDGLAKVLRKELRADGVRVANVYPGGIDTPFREAARPEYLAAKSVAEAILALAEADESVAPDELVLRPLVEKNFA
ncbi:MAG: SDR family NAD(P)-dependent oxidoreductase [Spirochaetaceae bacterium]|nr:SDR family NAD(P)-dependent oxidoreductase [Spirochaetaceae bacterium]